VGDFNTLLSPIDKSSKHKNQQRNPRTKYCHKTNRPNWCLQNITCVNKTIYILFSNPWNFLQNSSCLRTQNKYKKIEITPCILSDHNALKLELNNKNNSRKYANNWRLNNTLINDQWVIAKIWEEIKSFLETNETENTAYQDLWDTANAVLRWKFIAISGYIKRTEGSQINDLMLHLKFLEKQEQTKPKRAHGEK
jgi:hypothetical protein